MANRNTSNLKPVRTKSEARERGRIGGIKSGEARREKKLLQDAANDSLNKKLANGLTTQENLHKIVEDRILYLSEHPEEVRSTDFTYLLDVYKTLRDTSGQKPVEKIQTIEPPTIVFDFAEGDADGEYKPQ